MRLFTWANSALTVTFLSSALYDYYWCCELCEWFRDRYC